MRKVKVSDVYLLHLYSPKVLAPPSKNKTENSALNSCPNVFSLVDDSVWSAEMVIVSSLDFVTVFEIVLASAVEYSYIKEV